MSKKGIKTGARKKILKLMKSNPKQLWSIPELLAEFQDATPKSMDSHLRVLRIDGEIDRHIDDDVNGDRQFAVSVKIEKIEPYVAQTHSGKGALSKKKKKGQLLSSKEIRSMFAAHYNNMAKLEDSCMAIIEHSEMTEKEMVKIRRFLKS